MKTILLTAALSLSSIAHAELISTYTSLESSCVTYDSAALHKDAEIDFSVAECPGLGGYQPFIAGADLRYPLHLVYNEKKIELTNIMTFHEVASEKLEWLFTRSAEGVVEYKALIHRVSYDSYDGEGKSVQALIVTKLAKEKSCPVGLVKSSTNMNEAARAIAAQVDTLKCMDLNRVNY